MKRTECGFVRPDNAPTEEAARALPTDVPHMTKEEGEKCIVWWHDESAYNTSEDTPILWGEKPIKPKGKVGRLWSLSLSRRKMATWHSAV